MNIESEIKQLVATKREGQYWDFKEKHHDNKASPLHDILCLANSLYKGNKYLIFGVSDPHTNCEIKGVDQGNRKSQTDLIDFLRSKPFAGDIRPEIELRIIKLEKHEIDVLIIFDRPLKPYYLREDYRDRDKLIKANNIYTRNIDTNTPIDKGADIRMIELMWRERFGLDVQPSDRIVDLLRKPEEWDKDIGNKDYAYHKYKLYLTNYRLIFKSHAMNRVTGKFSIFLPTIKSVSDTSQFFTKRIKVATYTQDFEFILWGIPPFIQAINSALSFLTEQQKIELKQYVRKNYEELSR